ncbi:MAG TPA: sugar ABC transporter permease, partial [Micrococcaceae bacterium]
MSVHSVKGGPAGRDAGAAASRQPAGGSASRKKKRNFLGKQPLGLLFSAPYVLYVLGVLAFPL